VVVYPRPKGLLESVVGWKSADNSDKEAVGQAVARILELVRPVARQMDAAGIKVGNSDQEDVLRMRELSSEP